MDHSLSPGIRGRISAHWHSLSGAKTIPAFGVRRAIAALGIKGAILWQFEFEFEFEFEWGVGSVAAATDDVGARGGRS